MQIIKWTSLMLIMILVTLLGNMLSKKYKNRVKELRELKAILNFIETKIEFTQQPLTEIFEEIAKTYENIIFKKLVKLQQESLETKTLNDIWKEALVDSKNILSLTDEDLKIIEQIGKNLGTTDISGQIKEIEITKQFIDNQIEKAELDRRKNERMYKTLGGIAGIGIVIILT